MSTALSESLYCPEHVLVYPSPSRPLGLGPLTWHERRSFEEFQGVVVPEEKTEGLRVGVLRVEVEVSR